MTGLPTGPTSPDYLTSTRLSKSLIDGDLSLLWASPTPLPKANLHPSRLRLKSIANITFSDDHLDGMLLPKGSAVILNVWGMHHDSKRWQEPEHFQPERFSDFPALASVYAVSSEGNKRDHFGYGASRRICPGMHLAERNLWSAL